MLSNVNLKASSIILGNNVDSKGQLSSKHGFVFTSINHKLKLISISKSKPNISKQNLLFYEFNVFFILLKVY